MNVDLAMEHGTTNNSHHFVNWEHVSTDQFFSRIIQLWNVPPYLSPISMLWIVDIHERWIRSPISQTRRRVEDWRHQSSRSIPIHTKKKASATYRNCWENYTGFKGWIERSRKGLSFFHCNLCNVDISIAEKRVGDVQRHKNEKRHSERE